MFSLKKKAFTLAELLVVVIVLGVLAAVAVPKFTRVLETRRTAEAENMLAAVRMEQEKRCALGRNYTGKISNIPAVAYARIGESRAKTENYTYTLTQTGVEAENTSGTYTLKIPSYKSGEICCEGAGCAALNKNYPACAAAETSLDECAAADVEIAEPEVPSGACAQDPDGCACLGTAAACCGVGSGAQWDGNSCTCPEGQQYENGKCIHEACEAGTTEPAPNTQGLTDDCPGNDSTAVYACTSGFVGTCTDVYTTYEIDNDFLEHLNHTYYKPVLGNPQLSVQWNVQSSWKSTPSYSLQLRQQSSRMNDPFLEFADAVYLAAGVVPMPGAAATTYHFTVPSRTQGQGIEVVTVGGILIEGKDKEELEKNKKSYYTRVTCCAQ